MIPVRSDSASNRAKTRIFSPKKHLSAPVATPPRFATTQTLTTQRPVNVGQLHLTKIGQILHVTDSTRNTYGKQQTSEEQQLIASSRQAGMDDCFQNASS